MAHEKCPIGRIGKTCGELSEGVITCNHSHRSGACESVVPQSGHKASLGLSTRVGQDNHDQPDETYGQRRHWIIALVGLRGSTEHGERLRTADLVAADIWASAQGTACGAPAPARFSDAGHSPGLGGGRRYRPRRSVGHLRTAPRSRCRARARPSFGKCSAHQQARRIAPPAKRWRYRDGQCTLDVQLYPDVQTKQFGTLAYEVKSDDNTDEGKRLCLAQIQSRVQARH